MIIRKPYAFLIKHFKKVHVALLLLCFYLYYITNKVNAFLREFSELGTYDSYNEPITKYLSLFTMLALIVLIAVSVSLVFLLKKKEKPWKLYLFPAIGYAAMFIVYTLLIGFFDTYTGNLEKAVFKAYLDMMGIITFLQFPSIIVFIIRILGLDLNKFNFKFDEEYLDLDNEDKEELEININVDKDNIKRQIKRFLRNTNYVYQEHKFVCNCIILILLLILGKNAYTYAFVTNKSYTVGQTFSADGYTIQLNKSYFTDKDFNGKVISKESNFIIVDVTITNNAEKRDLDLAKFHIMNGTKDYTYTAKTYGTEFQDLGDTYKSKELRRDESLNMILVFKVSKELKENRFVLYYQELNGGNIHLRKIKLKLNNISEIKKENTLLIGEEFKFKVRDQKETIVFEEYQILNKFDYTYRICNTSSCNNLYGTYTAPQNYKVLKIAFASDTYEGKDMIDFSSKYGKINYIDNNKSKSVEIKSPIQKTYYGKYLYIKVPAAIETSQSIELEYTIRDKNYVYKLR